MEESSKPTVMAVGLRYGLIMALVSIALNLVLIVIGTNPFERGWESYIGIVFLIALVFLAHQYFKQNGDGFMSYAQGLGIAVISVFISIIIGGIFNFLYIRFIDPNLMEVVWDKARERMEEQGQSEEVIEKGLGIARKFFWVFFVFGGLIWGLIIGLIVSIFTQKKQPEPGY